MIKKILAALLIIAMSKPLLISGIISQSDSIPGALASPLEEEPNLPDGLRLEAEVGLDDFLISRMGQAPDEDSHAGPPAAVYNATANEYLVVWGGYEAWEGEKGIFSQRIDAATGELLGLAVNISSIRPDWEASGTHFFEPAVSFNYQANEYLVVWQCWYYSNSFQARDKEIFGQRLNSTGEEIGSNDFPISSMGPVGDEESFARSPAATYNSFSNEYLVVWHGIDAPSSRGLELYGQRLTASGAATGADDFQISVMGPNGDPSYFASSPSVVTNGTSGETLVAWHGVDTVSGEVEIYGQLLSFAGVEIGPNDFRISSMGPDEDVDYDAYLPSLAFNVIAQEYFVVWKGDDEVDGEFEVYGQRISSSGAEVGSDDFRISDTGWEGQAFPEDYGVEVVFNSSRDEYLAVWDAMEGLEREVYSQRLSAGGDEIGSDDLKISSMGPDGDDSYLAAFPTLAYNNSDRQYLVVWQGTDLGAALESSPEAAAAAPGSPQLSGEYEIYGQRLNETGMEIGTDDFRISCMGPDPASGGASSPDIAFNSTDERYLVVWSGKPVLGDGGWEVFGQFLNGVDGSLYGAAFQVSTMGPAGSAAFHASAPAVAWNSTNNEYLVVWHGDDSVDGELEIYGQRLDSAGGQVGTDDFRISTMGVEGSVAYEAKNPRLVFNSANNEYMIVWEGDTNTAPLVDNEKEIFGRRISALGVPLGADEFRISSMGPDGDANYDASEPDIAYNSLWNETLVVWSGDTDAGLVVNDDFEIYGRWLNALGTPLGTDELRISAMGWDDHTDWNAFTPKAVYNSLSNEYLVVWRGNDNAPIFVDEFEIFGQRLTAAGVETGDNDFLISDIGGIGVTAYDAFLPAVGYNLQTNQYLAAWQSDKDSAVDDEFEIQIQRLDSLGAQVGPDDLRISSMGPDGSSHFSAAAAAVACKSAEDECLLVWMGDDDTPPLMDNEFEIFGQRLDATWTWSLFMPVVVR